MMPLRTLPSCLPVRHGGDDRLVDSAAGTKENPAAEDEQSLGEANKKSPAAGTDKQTEDQPKSPSAAAIVDSSLQEVVRQEVEKLVEGSTAFVQAILGCHSSLVDLSK